MVAGEKINFNYIPFIQEKSDADDEHLIFFLAIFTCLLEPCLMIETSLPSREDFSLPNRSTLKK